MKVAIIGCGKIADEHAAAIRLMPGAEICAVCDTEELMAGQLAERLGIQRYFTDASELLKVARPDVVHITTPPQGHFKLARLCVEAGSHVFIEKPFTVTAPEADELIQLAEQKNVKLTAGHNNQFNPVAVRMRELVNRGFLGGPAAHMESTFCYDLGDGYAKALLGDTKHWVRALPGQLLHNVISHGVSKIAEFIHAAQPEVKVHAHQSPTLKAAGKSDIIDELRVIIAGDDDVTGYFTFSSQIKPNRHEFRLYGPKNYIIADHTHQLLTTSLPKVYKSHLNAFIPPFLDARQCLGGGWRNISDFLHKRFHPDSGRRLLLRLFYESARNGTPPPIPYREILLTARIMDSIFEQLPSARQARGTFARTEDASLPR